MDIDNKNTIFESFTNGLYESINSLCDYEHRRKKKRKVCHLYSIFDEHTLYSDDESDNDDVESDFNYGMTIRRLYIKYRLKT